jgi:hypothetical protein
MKQRSTTLGGLRLHLQAEALHADVRGRVRAVPAIMAAGNGEQVHDMRDRGFARSSARADGKLGVVSAIPLESKAPMKRVAVMEGKL